MFWRGGPGDLEMGDGGRKWGKVGRALEGRVIGCIVVGRIGRIYRLCASAVCSDKCPFMTASSEAEVPARTRKGHSAETTGQSMSNPKRPLFLIIISQGEQIG